MTYCPCEGHSVVNIVNSAGTDSFVKWVSLKQIVPCNLSVVLDTYTENPRIERAEKFVKTALERKIIIQKAYLFLLENTFTFSTFLSCGVIFHKKVFTLEQMVYILDKMIFLNVEIPVDF